VLERSIAHAALPASVNVEVVPATGSPAKALLDACSDADLIVLGRAGRSLLRGRVLGSVATQISHHARIPAVFVNADDRS
jgi:nucleotide-binding universal stress UspA family protein